MFPRDLLQGPRRTKGLDPVSGAAQSHRARHTAVTQQEWCRPGVAPRPARWPPHGAPDPPSCSPAPHGGDDRLTLGEVVITQGTLPAQAPEGNVPRTPFPAPWSPSQLSPPWALAPCKCRSWSQQPLGPSGAETSLLCNPISGDMGSSEHRGAAGRGQRAPPSSEAPTTCPAM